MKPNCRNSLISSRSTRLFAVSGMIAILTVNVLCYYFFYVADNLVSGYSPDKIPNRNITDFYFAPLVLRRGSKIDKAAVISHLRNIAYQENGTGAGGYVIENDRIIVNSRFPNIFPNAVIRFERDRVASLAVDDQSTDELAIEPYQMNTSIHFFNAGIARNLTKEQRTRRVVVRPENIPQMVKDVIPSSEDYKFFENQGIDWVAIPKRVLTGAGGGSGITTQIAKNNFYSGASQDAFWKVGLPQIIERKAIAEPFIALTLNERFSKDELFAAYVNMIPFSSSNGIELQGIVSASQEFFSKSQLSDLTLPEIASLAAMISYPSGYLNYVRNGNKCPNKSDEKPALFGRIGERLNHLFGLINNEPKKPTTPPCRDLLWKRNIVLDLVYRNHPEKYSKETIEAAKLAPLKFVFSSEQNESRPVDNYSGLFARFALNRLPEELNHLRSEEGNVKVITTLDPQLQKAAFEISENALKTWQPKIDQSLRRQKAKNPEKYAKIVADCEGQNSDTAGLSQHQNCDPSRLFMAQVSLVALDAQTGEVITMVGGIDTRFNYATMARRSAASGGKPFIYLEAIRDGRSSDGSPITAATYVDKLVENNRLNGLCVNDEAKLGVSGTLRRQLQMSSNIGACFAAQSTGIPNEFVGRLLNNDPPKSLQIAIGVGTETTLLDLVQAYTIFPNNGRFIPATAFKSAYQQDRKIEFSHPSSPIRTNPEATYIVTDMLRSVVESGTAAGFKKMAKMPDDLHFAGKTGTGMAADLLFVGFTPRMVVGVWFGMDKNFPELRMSDGFQGGKVAAPIAAKFMQAVAKYRPDLLQGEFVQPNGVIKLRVNEKGCVVEDGGRDEFFIAGRIPNNCE